MDLAHPEISVAPPMPDPWFYPKRRGGGKGKGTERDKFGRKDENWEGSLEQGRRLAKAGPGKQTDIFLFRTVIALLFLCRKRSAACLEIGLEYAAASDIQKLTKKLPTKSLTIF